MHGNQSTLAVPADAAARAVSMLRLLALLNVAPASAIAPLVHARGVTPFGMGSHLALGVGGGARSYGAGGARQRLAPPRMSEEEEEEELVDPVDWDAAWQAEVALPLFVESLARNYNTGMEPKQVAMQRLVGVCIAIGVFCAVCHLYVLHTGGILIMPDGIYTIHERSRGAGKLLPSTAVLSLHRNLFGALF